MAAALSAKQNAFVANASFGRTTRAVAPVSRGALQVAAAGMKETRDRIASVKNTSKITEAMKLVAAAKVRRAQDAVINSRPFTENLVKVLYGINQRLRVEDVDSPLCTVRPVKRVQLVVITGDRGLCGGYNNFVLKQMEARYKALTELGCEVQIIAIGRKAQQYLKRRPKFTVTANFFMSKVPTMDDATAICDKVFAAFVASEVDKVELIYTKFLSLVSSKPTIQTLLPLAPSGELCNADGTCVDAAEDEIFKLTSKGGKFEVEREKRTIETEELDAGLIFEQEPAQIMDTLLPLYLNSCLLRALQEALASELAARMTAMNNATDNAKELRKALNQVYNRRRQARITQELAELVAGAAAT